MTFFVFPDAAFILLAVNLIPIISEILRYSRKLREDSIVTIKKYDGLYFRKPLQRAHMETIV